MDATFNENHFGGDMEEKSPTTYPRKGPLINTNYDCVKTSFSYTDEDHPTELCCPITLTLMKEPVLLMSDGHTCYVISKNM